MINPHIFKAYDIRGIYPTEINENAIHEIGIAFGHYLKNGLVVIGHDARLSSSSLYSAIIKALKGYSNELSIIEGGAMTTPMLYFLVGRRGADAGIMITASHNPKEYNGLKIVKKEAEPFSGKDIYALINNLSNE